MGIRFYCPNGHKLNVKAFLAGKRGRCPECGARVRIPAQSTRTRRKSSEVECLTDAPRCQPPPLPSQPRPEVLSDDSQELAWLSEPEYSEPVDEVTPTPNPLVFEELDFHALEAPEAPGRTAPPRAQGRPGKSAEIAWYVRPPAGGQFGPATDDVIQAWIEEGRVPLDSLVWREGWRDWRIVSAAFPQWAAEHDSTQLRSLATREPARHKASPDSARPPSNSPVILLVALIVTMVVIVLGVLIWSLSRGTAPTPSPGLLWTSELGFLWNPATIKQLKQL